MIFDGKKFRRSYAHGVFHMYGSNLACFYSLSTGSQVLMNRSFDRSNPDLGQLADGRLILNVGGEAYIGPRVSGE